MSANKQTTRPEPDQRLLVLLAVGLALWLGPFLSEYLSPSKWKQTTTPLVYLWLTGALPEGLYRLTPESWRSEMTTRYGLPDLPLTLDPGKPPLAIQLQAGRSLVAAKLPADLAPFFFAPVAVNHADRELLMTLPGIGPRLADAIIALRLEKKNLHQLDELLEVKGIGKVKIAKLEGRVSFD